jgi:protein gp37
MSDLFHEEIPLAYVQKVFAVMNRASWHNFQVLTKRATRLVDLASKLLWTSNIWQGVSVESPEYLWRADCLRNVPARVRFLSIEPLLQPFPRISLSGIDWVIVGGESGPSRRPVLAEWIRSIRDQCKDDEVAFFFKQWGGRTAKSGGNTLDGRTWLEYPAKDVKFAQPPGTRLQSIS